MKPITLALYFGNRGFFPGELIDKARRDLTEAVGQAGCRALVMDESLTRYGAVETRDEGRLYGEFLKQNAGKYQGLVLCLPNFGDENGAIEALQGQCVPILVLACRDHLDKMDFAHRRDAVCGKFAMCNMLRQAGLRYTLYSPFAVDLDDAVCREQLERFAAVCRVTDGMKQFNIGAIGARTTAFKTVRVDEIALQRHGVNLESFDLSEIMARMEEVSPERMEEKKAAYLDITIFEGFPGEKLDCIARLGAVIDELIQQYHLHAVAIRCWDELEKRYGIAPCLILGELNERGIQAACEVDVSNAVMMRALSLAGSGRSMLLDINNNYEAAADKCIVFHCGPVPISMMTGKGTTIEHKMFAKSYGEGSGVGVNKGEIAPGTVTFGSLKTENGRLYSFLGEGELGTEPLGEGFFGTGAVLHHPEMDRLMNYIAREGYRHHLSIGTGCAADIMQEALTNYLGYEVARF